MTRDEELQDELTRLTQELEEVNERLNDVRPPNAKPITATKELLRAYELLLTRKTQIEKRMREISIEITQRPKGKKRR